MNFFKLSDLAKSWSVWMASLVTVTPIINETTDVFSFIPEQYKPLAVTVLGIATLVARAIKQTKTTFSNS